MQRELTVRLSVLLSLGLSSACDSTDTEERMALDAGRDASTVDAARLDGAPSDLDATTGRVPDADVAADAGADAAWSGRVQALLALRLAELTTSRAKWHELAAASPGPYWYSEENCLINSLRGRVSTIQVEQNVSRVFEEGSIDRIDCEARVNRYGTRITASGGTETLEQLYDVCEAQLQRAPGSSFSLDARGVIKACWIGQADNCLDNCGSGFYLREWQFGTATPRPDAGVRNDAGVATDAGR